MAVQLDQQDPITRVATRGDRAGTPRRERQASRENLLRAARQTLVQMRALGPRSGSLRGRDAAR